ncbi:uncharacterized protein BO80DRAFT_283479 [Aspergillus ibericus CBS 121593]|uniref:Uncharacterized protein n=1 Tax=Aspergillus ibericus CBS 121593 TaxID=1448316 RepID=A0A395H975_9EURO|nr:hypothetical protein BO80DRAFT_283479 [Aspergillus ibericus CBS 121593]RAL03438.1 hypothetical protein BO80DRAFT_283479 [Aspergillus ibericus CBS 121593]
MSMPVPNTTMACGSKMKPAAVTSTTPPAASPTSKVFSKQASIGYLSTSRYADLKEHFSDCATPTRQKAWNDSTNTTEPIKWIQPTIFYTPNHLEKFEFRALETDQYFVEQELLPRVWDFAVPFDNYERESSGFFPVAQWVPQGGGPLSFTPVVQWLARGY